MSKKKKPIETVERVIMNVENAEIGLAIRLHFLDKDHTEELAGMEGYSMRLSTEEVDGYLLFSGAPESNGPWVYVSKELIDKKCEDLGFL